MLRELFLLLALLTVAAMLLRAIQLLERARSCYCRFYSSPNY